MSASSSKNADKDEQVDKDCEPKWLEDFLSKSFFDSCTAHPLHRNELSIYCVNCNLSVCHYCASSGSHHQHKMLKLYRHNYKDVVSVASMKKHINCSQIQLFKNKKHSVIALKPLPHRGSANKNDASSCDICSRRLSEPDLYRYCSISCKVEAVSRKPNDSVPPFISIQSIPQEQKEETTEPPKRRNKRKGTPRRAPLF